MPEFIRTLVGFTRNTGRAMFVGMRWLNASFKASLRKRTLLIFIWVLLIVITAATEVYARGGGGGFSGGGIGGASGCRGSSCYIEYILYLVGFVYLGFVGLVISLRHQKVARTLKEMAKEEPDWSPDNLRNIAKEKFVLLQDAWGEHDLESLKQNLHPSLYPKWEANIKAQIERDERNILSSFTVSKVRIVGAKNFQDDEKDEFTVAINASGYDKTIKTNLADLDKVVKGEVAHIDHTIFMEFWTFQWSNGDWLLREVKQFRSWVRFLYASIIYEKPK